MKRIILMILSAAFAASCTNEVTPEYGVTLNKDEHIMELGDSYKFIVNAVPSASELVWMSSKPEVCPVDNTGTISGLSVGESWVYCFNNSGIDSCHVEVVLPDIESLMLSKHQMTLSVGEEAQLKVYLSPSTLDPGVVIWSSSDEAIAVVRQDGTVRGVAAGTAVVTAEAYGKSDECKVVVK